MSFISKGSLPEKWMKKIEGHQLCQVQLVKKAVKMDLVMALTITDHCIRWTRQP